ncbi:MAG: hypothetical protein JXA82_13770 [Sedimentisphaerales bacterium]|nr:hypothetical protein [Sedimentisphaerales bacterium]
MVRNRSYIALSVLIGILSFSAWSQIQDPYQELFSPLTAETFHKVAHEIYTAPDVTENQLAQAVWFLEAVTRLDRRPNYVYADLLRACSRSTQPNYIEIVMQVLAEYAADANIDLQVAREAVDYLLSTADNRTRREEVLGALLKATSDKNTLLRSDLQMRLGFLAAERVDNETATAYLSMAYEANPYNQAVFAKVNELARQSGRMILEDVAAKHLRLAIQANPLRLDTAVSFAQYSELLGMYSVAVGTYTFCADLYEYLYPDQPLPASLYLPWALACYNTTRQQDKCIQIALKIRRQGQFDLLLEGIAAAAALEMGNQEQYQRFLAAGQEAENLLARDAQSSQVKPLQLAWFYSFVDANPEKALAWANKAFAADPDDAQVKAVFSHALTMNNQPDLAKEYIANLTDNNQIAAFTQATILLAEGKKEEAIKGWKQSIEMDVMSLVAHRARKVLLANDSEYVSTLSPEPVLQALNEQFGSRVVPQFRTTSQLLAAKFNVSGLEFSFGRSLDAQFTVVNQLNDGPLVIAPEGVFQGHIRVDALVRGDVTAAFPALIDRTIRPGAEVGPRQHASVGLDLITGPLRDLLLTHPQASVQIEFVAYLDPVFDAAGNVYNGIPGIEPTTVVVKREGVNISQSYLLQRLDALAKGLEGQKVRAGQLFTGLLAEQYTMKKSGPIYRHIYIEKAVLVDAVRRGLKDSNWKVRVQALAALTMLPVPLEYELTTAVSNNLSSEEWPVRLMTLYVLQRSQDKAFQKVLDWTVRFDTHPSVRAMAVALGGAIPQESNTSEAAQP